MLSSLVKAVVAVALSVGAYASAGALTLYGSAFSQREAQSKLYTVDTTNGRATLVGGDAGAYFPGLAFALDGRLFGSGSSLWSIDSTTGHAAMIGALPELIVSIAFDSNGRLWGLGNGTGTLWQVDPSNGRSIQAGFLDGLQPGGIRSIAFDQGGTLFGIGQGSLYKLSTTDFTASVIARVTPSFFIEGLAFGSDGRLYTSQGSSLYGTSTLNVVNTSTGALSSIGRATTTPPALFLSGLAAPVSAVPEMSSAALLAIGLLLLLSRSRYGKGSV